MRVFTVAERRARLGRRHFLSAPGASVDEVTAALVGLHATDPTTPAPAAGVRLTSTTAPVGFPPFVANFSSTAPATTMGSDFPNAASAFVHPISMSPAMDGPSDRSSFHFSTSKDDHQPGA